MTTTPQPPLAIGFIIEKAPEGGYKLAEITSLAGELKAKVIAYCTTLTEVQEIEHQKKAVLFGERAWYPMPRQPVQPALPAASQFQMPDPDPDMPRVVTEQQIWPNGTLQDRLRANARVLMPLMIMTAMAGGWLV